MSQLKPEEGGGGVEFSQVGYTRQEAEANWKAFKANVDGINPGQDFRALWEKVKTMVEALIAKLPV